MASDAYRGYLMSNLAGYIGPDRPWVLAVGVTLLLATLAQAGSGPLAVVGSSSIATGSLMLLCGWLKPFKLFAVAAFWATALGVLGQPAAGLAIACAIAPLLLAARSLRKADRKTRQISDQRQRQAEQKSRLVHDLRTPLNGISGAFEMLKRRDLDRRGHKYVTLGMASCDDMAKLLTTTEGQDLDCRETSQSMTDVFAQSQTIGAQAARFPGGLFVTGRDLSHRDGPAAHAEATGPARRDAAVL